MNKQEFTKTLENLLKTSKKKKFKQTIDLIINLRDLDIKKTPIDLFIHLNHSKGKEIKVCAVLDHDLEKTSKEICDKILTKEELTKLDKKEIKKISREYDFFLAQANLMGQVATTLGRILGPLGKMPNPKAGGVVTPATDIKDTVNKFKHTLRLRTINEASIKCPIGQEGMDNEQITNNIVNVYEHLIQILPKQEQNIKSILLKLTMGKPIKVGAKEE